MATKREGYGTYKSYVNISFVPLQVDEIFNVPGIGPVVGGTLERLAALLLLLCYNCGWQTLVIINNYWMRLSMIS